MRDLTSRLRKGRVVPGVEALEDRLFLNAGALDPSFGAGGQVVLPALHGNDEEAHSLLVQPDGKIVVAGFAFNSAAGDGEVRVTRLNPDGSPDRAFGGGTRILDIIHTPLPSFSLSDDTVLLARQSDGKLLVGATLARTDTDSDFVVARLNPQDGSLDTTFGSGGTATVDFNLPGSRSTDQLRALTLDEQGRIVLAGNADVGGSARFDFDMAVARLRPDGTPDPDFNGTGKATISFAPDSPEQVTAVALQGTRILVAGYDSSDSAPRFAVARLNADGRLDPTFGDPGNPGRRSIDVGGRGADNRAHALAVQPWDGKIVLAGYSDVGGSGFNFSAVRLDADGGLDSGFGTGGVKTIPFSADFPDNRANALLLRDDRKILIAGFNQREGNPSAFGFAAVRLEADGRLDPNFGAGGERTFVIAGPRGSAVDNGPPSFDDKVFAAALQPDGKVVLAGHFGLNPDQNMQFAVVRLLEADLPPTPPAPAPAPPSVVGIQGPFVGKVRKPALFQALLSDPRAANAVFCFWMVTVGTGRRLRLVGSGVGPSFRFLPTAAGSYTVTLFAGGVTFLFSLKV